MGGHVDWPHSEPVRWKMFPCAELGRTNGNLSVSIFISKTISVNHHIHPKFWFLIWQIKKNALAVIQLMKIWYNKAMYDTCGFYEPLGNHGFLPLAAIVRVVSCMWPSLCPSLSILNNVTALTLQGLQIVAWNLVGTVPWSWSLFKMAMLGQFLNVQ